MPKIVYVVTGSIETGLKEKFFEAASASDAAAWQRYWEDMGAVYTEIMDEIPVLEEDLITQAMLGQ